MLEWLYVDILKRLRQDGEHPTDRAAMEAVLIDILADHLMGGIDPAEHLSDTDISRLAERYSGFENRLRRTLYERISEAQEH